MPMAPAPSPRAGATATIVFDGRALPAVPGESLAATLIAAGLKAQSTGKDGRPRGHYCGMGVCHECLVVVDGRAGQRACLSRSEDGQDIRSHPARIDLLDPELVDLAELPLDMAETSVDVLVVGAGPAGLAAAEAAARLGASVTVLDERPGPGGQFYKQRQGMAARDGQMRDGATLIERVRDLGVAIRGETLVWGAERDKEGRLVLGTLCRGRAGRWSPRVLVVATGAFETPLAVPGWTLPGVMTTGGAQTLVRSYGVPAGRRVLVAGNGPLNLQVALELSAAGSTVAAVLDRAPAPHARPREAGRLVMSHPALAVAGMRQMARLRTSGIPLSWSSGLLRIEGDGRVEAAVFATPAGERRVEVDAVVVGNGFASASELSRLLGCAHRDAGGRLEVERDETGRTSQSDVFVIGEAGRFAGAHVALAQGRLAGRAVARKLGFDAAIEADEERADRRRLARHETFQAALWTLFDASDAAPPSPDTLACRCEAVSFAALSRALEDGPHGDTASLKRLTRAGMGRCQGRYCGPVLARAAARDPKARAVVPKLAAQMPLRPIPLAALALEKPEWGGHRRALLPDRPAADAEPLPTLSVGTLVIGAGIAGLSTALFLARAGEDVAVVERGVPNSGASGGNAGSLHAQLLSFDYGARAEAGGGPAARTLGLQRDAIDLWRALERELEADFEIKLTGGLMVAETEEHLRFLEAKTAVERAEGIDCHLIDAAELRRREPALSERFLGAAFCPQEGKINPLVATEGILLAALAAGARLYAQAEIRAIRRDGDAYAVETSRGTIRARRIVNAAGAFASRIGAMLGLDVPVFGAPLQMVVTEAVAPLVSCLVAHAGRHLTLKQAANGNIIIGGGWTAGLDPVNQHPRPLFDSLEGNLWVAQHVVPALRKAHVIRSWAAMNINIDGAPILGEHPDAPGFFNAVTSNGYTLGPLVGRITADLVAGRPATHDIGPFSVTRFAKGRP
ncbi:FAD-dependent oxidoreductase [Aureimonas sp. AU22]|uniref:FAD-dependent oxidoreductase n=1 Tax=Aureimonas sp. AU22 TaxID=1638162 RepID=UPI00351C5D14